MEELLQGIHGMIPVILYVLVLGALLGVLSFTLKLLFQFFYRDITEIKKGIEDIKKKLNKQYP